MAYLLEQDPIRQEYLSTFLNDLINEEPGCTHPVSDRYAISIVIACLVLIKSGFREAARKLIVNTVVFVCDRHEYGYGLASVDATVDEEVQRLLGYPFDSFELDKSSMSFLSTSLADLAAFFGDANLYESVVNDLIAAGIYPTYWQCQDTEGQFLLNGEDVLQYPSVVFDENFSDFKMMDYSQHIRKEARNYARLSERGYPSFLAIGALLRDRYFPSLWHIEA